MAITDFDEAIRQSPSYAQALYGRGLAKQKKGDLQDGIRDLKKATSIQSDIAKSFAADFNLK